MKNNLGFTLIELMVVVVAISLLATAVLVTTHNMRVKARDTKRVALVTQMQNVLETYYRDYGYYPAVVTPGSVLVGADDDIEYMVEVPHNPEPRDDGDCAGGDFSYTRANDGFDYCFEFCLGGPTGGISAGINIATPKGITTETCKF